MKSCNENSAVRTSHFRVLLHMLILLTPHKHLPRWVVLLLSFAETEIDTPWG